MELLISQTVNRLVIEWPVRHGKSWYNSFCLAAWLRLTQPNAHIAVVSYGGNFASEWSAKIRDLVKEWGHLTGVKLHPDFQAKDFFVLAPPYIGELRGLGIGGSLAGKGFHYVICDDLVKEFSEVATEESRDTLYKRFHGEVLSRLEPGAKVIMVMSRRHPDDLSGRLMASNPDLEPEHQWHNIKFPALDENNNALWPERYPTKELLAIKRDHEASGEPWIWHCLYQQDPATAAELCEWPATYWKEPFFYSELPKFKPKFTLISLDPSMGKDRHKGDFSALLLGLVDPEDTLYIDDPILVRRPVNEIEDLTVAMIAQRRPDAVAVEVNGFQEYVAKNIFRKSGPLCPIYPYENMRVQEQKISPGPGKGKEVDIRMLLTPILSRHQVRIRDTPQGRILAQQLRDFPLASHDDGPDALCQMIRLWRDLIHGMGTTASRDQAVLTN